MSFTRKRITLTFQLRTGGFDQGSSNKETVTGVRCFVTVSQAVTPTPSNAMIRVYGLTPNQINTLTKAGYSYQTAANYVAIQAGDDATGQPVIFNGTIVEAYPDFAEQPEVGFVIIVNAAAVIQLQPVPPVSFPGSVSAVTALTQIMKSVGYTVENNGVNVMLASPYFQGTAWQQAVSLCTAANVFSYVDAVAKKIAIWPRSDARSGDAPIIGPAATQPDIIMIGYPEFMQNRIKIRAIFNPTLKGVGCKVQVRSQLQSANRIWILDQVDYNISAEAPGGPWEMTILAHPAGGTQ